MKGPYSYSMRFVHRLCRPTMIIALLFGLQGCSTPLFDAVLPRIDRGNGWSVDASGYLIYRESIIGPRLAIFVSPLFKSGHPPKPLRIQLTILNGFDATVSLDPRQIVLEVSGQRYAASAATCDSPPSSIGARIVTLQELSRGPMEPCVYLLFDVQQPDDWTRVSLHMNGLSKNNQKITVPEIRFYKTKIKARGSFI